MSLFKKLKQKMKRINLLDMYADWLDLLQKNKSDFVPMTNAPFVRNDSDIKIFAYYLPQFYAIPENDLAHGLGFTEWTNVAACKPMFVGHVQPKIPYDLGFYSLRDINVMRRQIEIAKTYGVYGFCFYYYWFSGKQVLDLPIKNFLSSDLDFHFHFCWANENWSKLWDGGNNEIILEQKLLDDDADKFFADILPFIKDSRYEKINNSPILMIYSPLMFDKEKLVKFLERLNFLATQHGFNGFFFTASNRMNFDCPHEYGIQGITEFPPHGLWDKTKNIPTQKISNRANFMIRDMGEYIRNKKYIYDTPYTLFKAVFPSWDNTPRKAYSYGSCFKMSTEEYKTWLEDVISWTRKNNADNMQYVYINAWNEWGEGAMLEPTTYHGYASIDIVKQALENDRKHLLKGK